MCGGCGNDHVVSLENVLQRIGFATSSSYFSCSLQQFCYCLFVVDVIFNIITRREVDENKGNNLLKALFEVNESVRNEKGLSALTVFLFQF